MKQLYTIIDGKKLKGTSNKSVIAPYSLRKVANINCYKLKDLKRTCIQKNDLEVLHVILNKLSKYLTSNQKKLAKIVAEETGSPLKYHVNDIKSVIMYINYLNNNPILFNNLYKLEPKGSLLIILSSNEPVILGTIPLLTALVAGNTVYLKPSTKTPSFSYLIVNKLIDLGISSKSIHLLLTDRHSIEMIIEKHLVDCVLSFGHHKTNRILGSLAARSGLEFISENDGNSWAYVDKCFSLSYEELVSTLIYSTIKHNGQMCDSLRGVFIHKDIFSKLSKDIITNIRKVRVGNPLYKDNDVGALISGTSFKVQSTVAEAKISPDKVYNYRVKNNIIYPTVIISPPMKSALVKEGVFAPVLWIKPVSNPGTVIKLHKSLNSHGLCFSIFSNNKKSIDLLTKNIHVGRINIESSPVEVDVTSPWGGISKSGFGGPANWIERFTNRKIINYGQF